MEIPKFGISLEVDDSKVSLKGSVLTGMSEFGMGGRPRRSRRWRSRRPGKTRTFFKQPLSSSSTID